jgi:CheY-like chemotaxis protein
LTERQINAEEILTSMKVTSGIEDLTANSLLSCALVKAGHEVVFAGNPLSVLLNLREQATRPVVLDLRLGQGQECYDANFWRAIRRQAQDSMSSAHLVEEMVQYAEREAMPALYFAGYVGNRVIPATVDVPLPRRVSAVARKLTGIEPVMLPEDITRAVQLIEAYTR